MPKLMLVIVLAMFAVGCGTDECLYSGCFAGLRVTVYGLPPFLAPLDVSACDGSYCADVVVEAEMCLVHETGEPPPPSGPAPFSVCLYGNDFQVSRGVVLGPGDPPPENTDVTLILTDASGTVLFDGGGTPALFPMVSCTGVECERRILELDPIP